MYRNVPADRLSLTECLATTIERAWPYFEREILPRMRADERVLDKRYLGDPGAVAAKMEVVANQGRA